MTEATPQPTKESFPSIKGGLKIEKKLCFLCEKPVYSNEGKVVDSKLLHAGCASKYWAKQAEEQKLKKSAIPRDKLFEGIVNQEKKLHHVETEDKSQPQIEAVPIRKNVHSSVMSEVQKVENRDLKHVETVDKGKPVIDSSIHVKKSKHPKVMEEIKGFKGFAEKKAEYERQAQAQTEVRTKVFEGIEQPHKLHHVEESQTHDTSKPNIENVTIRKNVHSQVFQEIQKAEHSELKHVETQDKAGPVLDKNVHLKKDVRPQLFDEIKALPTLSEKKLIYEQTVSSANKLNDDFKNREGSDTNELSGLAKNKKMEYEKNVEESSKLPKNKEGSDTTELSGITQRSKEQYSKEVELKNQDLGGTQLERDGDKVIYKNLPPKKDLNDLI